MCLGGVEIKNQTYIFLVYNNFSKNIAVFFFALSYLISPFPSHFAGLRVSKSDWSDCGLILSSILKGH